VENLKPAQNHVTASVSSSTMELGENVDMLKDKFCV